jgi:hypothetical protein
VNSWGLASPDGTSLYVTNFKRGQVEIYNGTFGLVDTFTDPNVPNGYALQPLPQPASRVA